MARLTPKQQAFADEYIANKGNATQSAIKAGYSEKSARDIGKENLTKPHIRDYIANKTAGELKRREFGAEEAINNLVSIASRERQTSYSKQYDHLKSDVVKEMTYTFQPSLEEATKAIELLMKYLGIDDNNNDLKREKLRLENLKLEQAVTPSETTENKLLDYLKALQEVYLDD